MFKYLRNISTIIKSNARYCTTNNSLNEIVKTVDPYSQIKIKSPYNISIRPYDLINCPDSNKLRITSVTKQLNNNNNTDENDIKMAIKVTDKVVEITCNDENENENVICLLEVPIKADLNIQSKGSIDISEMYSDHVQVAAKNNIQIKNLRSTTVDLFSIDGNIDCKGTILAHKIELLTKNKGNIILDKLQGDLLQCKTENGDVNVNSCYVENSKFATEKGNLNLRNIHKKTEVFVLEKGNIQMSGIHGNVYVKSSAGDLDLQFSEIDGENIIIGENSENVIINISDVIEHDSYIEINSDGIELDSSLSHLLDCLRATNKHFVLGQEYEHSNKLMICTKGNLKLGKMSWAESVKLAMGIKDI